MSKKKTSLKLWRKTVITLASFAIATGIVFAALYGATKKSKEIYGTINQTPVSQLNNAIDLNNPQIYFYHLNPDEALASVQLKNGKYTIVYKNKDYQYHAFLDLIFNEKNKLPNLVVQYGSFKFVNEYPEAVEMDEFIRFADWFIKNVAWGADILSLKTFSIVRGVSIAGSSITLGAHANSQKELTEIKFYPDSFFGSMPIFSTSGGRSQYDDSLTYPLNKKVITKQEVQRYLDNVKYMNIRANDNTEQSSKLSFRNLSFAHLLKDKKLFTYQLGAFVIPIHAQKQVDAYNKLLKLVSTLPENERFNVEFSKVIPSRITNIQTRSSLTNNEPSGINIFFDTGFSSTINETDFKPITLFALDQLEAVTKASFVSFKDFYNINQYLNKQIFVYDIESKYPKFFETAIQARDSVPNFDASKLKLYNFSSFSVANKKMTIDFVQPKNLDPNEVIHVVNFDALDESNELFESFKSFKQALGYKNVVKPYTIKLISEEKDANNKTIEYFEIYNEAYQNLLEAVHRYRPTVLKEINGYHIKKVINDDGELTYQVVNGKYKGLDPNDRIPFIAMMYLSDPNFKGISFDFLRYVGAHEYGHHLTLENAQNVSSDTSPSLVGGLSLLGGANILSYFHTDVLRNYLKARSTIDFTKVDVNQKPNKNGSYTRFNWVDQNNKKIDETLDDVWGSVDKTNLQGVIENKRRRFVQDFSTLKEAAEKRGVRISDLFIMNSYDTESGTLNPLIIGKAKYMVFKPDGSYEFKTASVDNIKNVFKDGMGRPIQFDDDNKPKVVEYSLDGKRINKVLIHDKFNQPIINVQLNKNLTEQEKEYVEKRVIQIQNDILKLVDVNYFNSGWNNRGFSVTSLGIDPKLSIVAQNRHTDQTLFDTNGNFIQNLKVWKEFIENRDKKQFNTNNVNSQTNRVGYYADLLASEQKNTPVTNFRAQVVNILQQSKRNNNALLSTSAFGNDLKNDLTVLRVQNEKKEFDNYTQYIVNPAQPLSNLDDLGKNTFFNIMGVKMLFEPPHRRLFNQLVQTRNTPNPNNKYWFLDENKKAFTTPIDETNRRKEYYSMAMKPNTLRSDFSANLFDAFNDQYLIDYVDDNNQTIKVLNFYAVEDFLAFHSLDFTKLKPTEVNNKTVWNWDIDYVKTKFNLDLFKQRYLNAVSSRQISEQAANELKALVATEQQVANMVMARFKDQQLDFYYVNSSIEDNFSNLLSIFEKRIGAAELDLSNYKNKNPDKKKFEYTAAELYDVIKKFYNDNNLDLKSLRLQDLYYLLANYGWLNYDTYQLNFDSLGQDNGIVKFNYKKPGPTQDVVDYNSSRAETSINDIFGDYVYNFPENLTRDYVQITYVPNTKDFGNLVNYLTNVNEANTGLEYVLDGSKTEQWKTGLIDFADILNHSRAIINDFSKERIERIINRDFDKEVLANNQEYLELVNNFKEIETNYQAKWSQNIKTLTDLRAQRTAELEKIAKYRSEQKNYMLPDKVKDLRALKGNVNQQEMYGLLLAKIENEENERNLSSIKEQLSAIVRENDRSRAFINDFKQQILNNQAQKSPLFDYYYQKTKELLESDPDSGIVYIDSQPYRSIKYIERTIRSINNRLVFLESEIAKNNELIKQYEALKKESGYKDGVYQPKVDEYNQLISASETKIKQIEAQINQLNTNKDFNIDREEYEAFKFTYDKNLEGLVNRLKNEYRTNLVGQLGISLSAGNDSYRSWRAFNSNYIGKLNTFNNGFFKDRWLRDELNWGLYDDQGKSVIDDKISILELDNKTKVKDRARAFWIYLLRSKGIGARTITGIWRDRQKDALTFWGYAKLSLLDKIDQIAFRDLKTNEIKYLKVHKDTTKNPQNYNNLFYLTKQADIKSKKTLADEGYGAWMSDYAFMAKYANTLLSVNNDYEMYFVDANKNRVDGLTLGDINGLAENGKTVAQAPVKITKQQIDNQEKTVISISPQFNAQ
ncbi:hypothetical protein JM47_01325 [Ureaplasma diversum]|uniref:PDxFFG protein n=1 Tax=Ureaplasma diversum TaxID=42094 RepID=A0A0C5RP68_9BACT|nr:PDxFFG protein [Ureaplasma diversum]AJQ45259.1 hypothetical protein JM47_01325 [Ureaplasma diversum]